MQRLRFAVVVVSVTNALISASHQVIGQDLDPVSITNPSLVSSEQWQQAVAIMDKTENGPSCPKRALTGLVESCQSIDTHENYHAQQELSDIKKAYAARLAVCELEGAKVNYAELRACDSVVVQPDDLVSRHKWWQVGRRGVQKSEGGPQIDKTQLEKCLKALHGTSQSWISYSNAISTTHLMCQVSRVELEKEQLLETYRTHTFAMGNQSELIRQQNSFIEHALNFQAEVREELSKMKTEDIPMMQTLLKEAAAGLVRYDQDFQSTVDKAMSGVKSSVADVEMRIQYMNDGLGAFGTGVDSILDAAQSRNSEIAVMHAAELQVLKTGTAEATIMVSSLRTDMTSLSQLVEFVMNTVVSAGQEFSQNMTRWRKEGAEHSEQLDAHKSKLEASTQLVAELNDGLTLLAQFITCAWLAIQASGGLLIALVGGYFFGRKTGAVLLLLSLGNIFGEEISRYAMVQTNRVLEYFSTSHSAFTMMIDGLPYAVIAILMTGVLCFFCHIVRAYRRSRRSIMDNEADDDDDEEFEKTHAAYY